MNSRHLEVRPGYLVIFKMAELWGRMETISEQLSNSLKSHDVVRSKFYQVIFVEYDFPWSHWFGCIILFCMKVLLELWITHRLKVCLYISSIDIFKFFFTNTTLRMNIMLPFHAYIKYFGPCFIWSASKSSSYGIYGSYGSYGKRSTIDHLGCLYDL